MKKIIVLTMCFAMICLAGCGKNEEAAASTEQATSTEDASAKPDKQAKNKAKSADKIVQKAEEDDSKQSDVILPEFDIVSENHMIEGDGGTYIVGTMQGEYLQPTDETAKEYPKLCESIEEFSKTIRDECEIVLSDFTKDARDYYSDLQKKNPGEEYFDGLRYHYYLREMRADAEYTSFYVMGDFFFGENDCAEYYYCYNFDSQTGELVEPDDVVTDADKLNDVVKKCYKDKYGEKLDFDVYDPKNPDTFCWCLTPIGIDVYFDNDGTFTDTSRGVYVNLDFDLYSDVINGKYRSNCADYVYPFDVNEEIGVDIDGDGKTDFISFTPTVPQDDTDTNDCEGYTVSVNGKVYDDFAEAWYFSCYPYYVHNADGNFIFAELIGYEGNRFEIISLDGGKPEYVKSLDAKKLGGAREVDEALYSQYRRPAFTNSSVLLDFTFSDLVYGPYIVAGRAGNKGYDSGEDMGQTSFEFYEVDGRCYVEHMNNFQYGAAEIELMNPKPEKVGEDYIFNVRFHYFSGFSFAGDYHGGGYICDVTVRDDGSITISGDNPFAEGGKINLAPLYDARIHYGILDNSEWNTECVKAEGSWRYQGITENDEIYEYYLELLDDGTAYYAVKNDTYPINLNVGIYSIEAGDNKDEHVITFDGEIMGYACMPCDTATFIYNSKDDTLKPVPSEYEVGGDEVEYHRTLPGKNGYPFDFGPAARTDELLKNWNEYMSY